MTPGPQLWGFTSCAYDHNGVFHIVWCEQRFANMSEDIAIKHWSDADGDIHTVTTGYYENDHNFSGYLNLNGLTFGIGDGVTYCTDAGSDNENFLYVLYDKACGETPEEQADVSALGVCNGELYLNVSQNGGANWSPRRNLTNTKSPDCNGYDPDSVCAAEQWATIGRDVSDIEIFYIHDFQAGGFPSTGWVINRAMYLNLPGGGVDAAFLCPEPYPLYGGSDLTQTTSPCGPNPLTPNESDTLRLVIHNLGIGDLQTNLSIVYTDPISPLSSWMTIDDSQSVSIVVPPDDSAIVAVVLHGSGLNLGEYDGRIDITHNDLTQAMPDANEITMTVNACLCHADPLCDQVTDVFDVLGAVAVAFQNGAPVFDATCPRERTDVTCDGFTDVFDVLAFVGVAFQNADPAVEFCEPCALP